MARTILNEPAKERSSYYIDVDFTDETGLPVTPKTCFWTLSKTDGTIVNNRERVVPGSLAASITIALSGDDLACDAGKERDGRVILVEATYDSVHGNDMPFKEQQYFDVENMVALPIDGATVTIASGTFARTAGVTHYRVAGEGGAADALTDITGAALADGEVLVLQVADASDPITITHATGVIELDGSANWIMNNAGDIIYLKYVLATTKWTEVGRVNARSDI
jgi:hypothetical protein